jgi:hypothetical protein
VRTATINGFDITLPADGHSTRDSSVLTAEQIEYLLQFLIIYFVMSKFGIKKGLKNKYSDFPKIN